MYVCVYICLARSNEVFNSGGLCQSAEGGPAIPLYCHSVGERVRKRTGGGGREELKKKREGEWIREERR